MSHRLEAHGPFGQFEYPVTQETYQTAESRQLGHGVQHQFPDQEDKSRAKLGTWFTGKSHIETMERRKGNLVFPTSVYLDNLASSVSQSSSRSQASSGAREKLALAQY